MKGFIYGQTEYNLLSSAIRLTDYVKYAKDNSFDFLTLTDKSLYASYKFYNLCKKNNIKPIIGIEYEYKVDNFKSKVLMYANNDNGYKNLMKISTIINTNPDIDYNELFKYSDISYIFVLDDSYLEALIKSNDYELLNNYLAKIKQMNAYIGISYTNKPYNYELNKKAEELANNFFIKCLPIHHALYLKSEDEIVYRALRKIDNDEANINPFDDYSFLINPTLDKRIDDFVKNINYELYNDKLDLPKFPNTKGVSSFEYLEALCYKGLSKRGINDKKYNNRLDYELSVINKMGYNDYFLIVWDYVRYAKTNNILVGPGRGSAAGSLVAYCLGITDIDPLKYDLLFERFLNPERVSMPDIDTDFPDTDRYKVIDYVKDLYGVKHVCNIATFGTFQIKSSARDLAKVFNIDQEKTNEIIKMISKYGYDKLIEEYKGRDLYDFLYVARGIENFPRNVATHPAGIIIGDRELDDIIPLQDGINGLLQAQLEKDDLESIGLLKMDFLGLRDLTLVSDMMSLVPGFDIKALRNIRLDDPNIYKVLSSADTLGIFQLASDGIKKVLLDLKPEKFTDLIAVIALYRPGPMDNIPDFIRRRHGEKFEYIHNDLAPILKETYGIIVYQEQIMQIAQVFAGFSLGEADLLRRAISKKDASKMDAIKIDFINRSIKKGYSDKLALDVYNLIYKFADYGFNKSHSVVYSYLAYQMLYFKVYHFNVFMTCMLNNVISDSSKMKEYIIYAKKRGLVILKPNVNVSTTRFIYEINRLFMPLNSIYSIGSIQANEIVTERNRNGLFKSYTDFKNRCSFLSASQMEALIYSGALDIFGKTKKSMIESKTIENDIIMTHLVGVVESNDEYDFDYLAQNEAKYLGINIQYNLFNDLPNLLNKYRCVSLKNMKENSFNNVIATISKSRTIKTKKGENMLVLSLTDGNTDISAVIFPRNYERLLPLIKKDKLLYITGPLERDKKNLLSFSITDIKDINN